MEFKNKICIQNLLIKSTISTYKQQATNKEISLKNKKLNHWSLIIIIQTRTLYQNLLGEVHDL